MELKLFLLRRISTTPEWDVTNGLIITAHSRDEARRIATQHSGDEGPSTWLSPHTSTCSELVPAEFPCLILRDFNAA